MQIIKLDNNLEESLNIAIEVLNSGGLIAYPTETFYGLGVRFDKPEAIKRLYNLKKRPLEKSMPLIIGEISQLELVVDDTWLREMPERVKNLIKAHWPGPLTILMPARRGLSEYLIGENGTVAVRIPGESFALHLVKKAGIPITATSANISSMPPAERAKKIIEYFDYSIDLLIDGGKTPGGLPSTIVDATKGLSVVRRGAILSVKSGHNP